MESAAKKIQEHDDVTVHRNGIHRTASGTTPLLTRSESAATLGISKTEFIRREDLGIYVPTLVDERGWHLFSLEYLSGCEGFKNGKLKGIRTTASAKAAHLKESFSFANRTPGWTYDIQDAAKIFELLDSGITSREIVKKLLIHPDVMSAVYDAWKKLGLQEGGGMTLSPSVMNAINTLPLPGIFPVTNGEQLLANLREASEQTPMCALCKKAPCRVCVSCGETMAEATRRKKR